MKRKAEQTATSDDDSRAKRAKVREEVKRQPAPAKEKKEKKERKKRVCCQCSGTQNLFAVADKTWVCRLCLCLENYMYCTDCKRYSAPQSKSCGHCCSKSIRLCIHFIRNKEVDAELLERIWVNPEDYDRDTRRKAWRFMNSTPGGVGVTFTFFEVQRERLEKAQEKLEELADEVSGTVETACSDLLAYDKTAQYYSTRLDLEDLATYAEHVVNSDE